MKLIVFFVANYFFLLAAGNGREMKERNIPVANGIINSIDLDEIAYPYKMLSIVTAIRGKTRKTSEA